MISENNNVQVKGRLHEINGRYHMIVNYKDEFGKWRQKSKTTGLLLKGNKKRAQQMLSEYEKSLKAVLGKLEIKNNPLVLFSDYMIFWLKEHKSKIKPSTYTSYRKIIYDSLVPYFENEQVNLLEINKVDIKKYYDHLKAKNLNANTIKKHHANIRKALQDAFKNELIGDNPADKVDLPKVTPYRGQYYDQKQLNKLFYLLEQNNHWLKDIIVLTSFYGLRRSEIIGLRWKSIDFDKNRITIDHTVVPCVDENGKGYWSMEDSTKTESSLRSLPLVDSSKDLLLNRRKKQYMYMKAYGKSYCTDYLDYVFVDEVGNLIKPDRATTNFRKFILKHDLPEIRFHDLRHSCASLLLNKGVSMKEIQVWLGHSNFNTTANIYAHVNDGAMEEQANVMESALLR